eukprot:CAMPEP_0204123900 /NCGR_PEP_ID=MMETSP0361-20130328/9547_1 /ASSEMBLY_ACC=CAM_ASM_000343 /TAXON_ID=268821 /ORGANISM="Scrippsiella Hangoei, Strain SHTV-5" /LENGTH=131 /DNA_ID=CAMNT_0051075401 /DNA_START=445 /DNA_END=838 /DNA_ORIENTATION=-
MIMPMYHGLGSPSVPEHHTSQTVHCLGMGGAYQMARHSESQAEHECLKILTALSKLVLLLVDEAPEASARFSGCQGGGPHAFGSQCSSSEHLAAAERLVLVVDSIQEFGHKAHCLLIARPILGADAEHQLI